MAQGLGPSLPPYLPQNSMRIPQLPPPLSAAPRSFLSQESLCRSQEMKARTHTEARKEKSSAASRQCREVFPQATNKNKYSQQNPVITQLPDCTLVSVNICVCVYMGVYVCVGSAVPPGCPESNWQLEKLWLQQGKVSKERDKERGGEKRTRHNIHKGRAGSAKCSEQSLIHVILTVPSPTQLSRGEGGYEKEMYLSSF